MQQAKQASTQQGTDDSDDQITDDSLAFPFCDPASRPPDQSPRTKQYPSTYILPASSRWCTSIGLLVSRSNRRRPQMFGNGEENDRLVIFKVGEQAERRECAGRNPERRRRLARPR